MIFTPLDDLQMVLTGEALASFIAPLPEALVSSTSVIHSHLNVRFEGVMVCELMKLLLDVQLALSNLVRSSSSIISTTAPCTGRATTTSMIGYLTSDVASRDLNFSESGNAPPVNISHKSSLMTPGLENMFTETVSVSGSDDAEE